MADFGANHPCFKPDGAPAGVILGKLVQANLTVNLASGELYADDGLAEQLSEFASGTTNFAWFAQNSLAMQTYDLTDANASILYGASVSDGIVTYNKNDTAPRGCLSYYKVLMRNGVKFFKAYFYPRVRAALGNDNAQTRSGSITFTPTDTTFTVFADDAGDWREVKTFDDATSASAWAEGRAAVGSYHSVTVMVQNAGDGEGADFVGRKLVADGAVFALGISGYASVNAAYMNGEDITAAVTGGSGTYEIASVTEDTSIVIIF
jgi:hypothetical protein